jgi:hypothetical protein
MKSVNVRLIDDFETEEIRESMLSRHLHLFFFGGALGMLFIIIGVLM